mmetsp:Transcript_31349/g.47842  ORF Transcript_31349/g.47842 Transcript_31349/m.47842 type:complete len:1055 (-) Transcript_31349:209-3373(-)
MDGELGSSRYGPADRGGGRGGGRHNRHHNRRGRGRGRGGGRHNRRHQPYHNNNHRRRGPRPPGNRFANDSTTIDPETAMQRQLSAMVSRVGELKEPEAQNNTSSEEDSEAPLMRPVMQAISKNIQDLSAVLCSEGNAALFLKFEKAQPEAPAPSLLAITGPLATLLVNCVATLPLQTPTYVGLTVAVDKCASEVECSGFAQRCVHYTMQVLSQQVDQILSGEKNFAKSTAVSQVKHLLRYLALLTRVNVITLISTENGDEDSFFGLLKTFAQVAVKASDRIVANLFKHWVLSTLPYLPKEATNANNFVKEELWTPLVGLSYESNFAPGIGCHALLLKTAQYEEGIKDDQEGDDDEEDDEEDDDEEEDAEQICDTLQDLIRCIKPIIIDQSNESATKTRFALFEDSPWKELTTNDDPANVSVQTLALPVLSSKYVPMILTGDDCCPYGYHHNLESTFLFGRLPIFGSPATDDDDDEMEEAPINAQLQAYEKEFSLLDRLLIADAVRECLLNHETIVTDTGVSRGEAKDTAQQVWSICHVVTKNDPVTTGQPEAPPTGIEYVLVETLLSLILQASSDSFLRPLYLSRVLLELVRSQPAVMPQALAIGVSNLFQFYLPTLVPSARDNFSRWFAFHLTNTDYQWPKAYWDHWASYVVASQNSRGDFVRYSLEVVAENLSSMETMVTTCLPPGCVLVNNIRQSSVNDAQREDFLLSLEKDTKERVWDRNEDPDLIVDYITGDEVSEALASISDKSALAWCRTRAIIRSLMQHVEKHIEVEEKQISSTVAGEKDGSNMEAENNPSSTSSEDVLAVTTDAILRYQSLIIASLKKDLENTGVKVENGEDNELRRGCACLLENMAFVAQNSRIFMEGCLTCLLDNDVVNTSSVIIWLLDQGKVLRVGHWWDYAILSFRVELNKVIQSSDVNMVVDREGDAMEGGASETMPPVKSINDFAAPLFRLATEKVLIRLSDIGERHHKGLSPIEVDLIEGLKLFVMTATVMVLEALTETEEHSTKMKTKMAMKYITEYSGPILAGICREHTPATKGINSLISIFEAMH